MKKINFQLHIQFSSQKVFMHVCAEKGELLSVVQQASVFKINSPL